MRSGLGKFGLTGVLAMLLLPPLIYATIRVSAHMYHRRAARNDEAARALLARLPEMETALTQARSALQPFPTGVPGEAGRAEEFSRWLLKTARDKKVELQGLAVTPVNDPASLTPALAADFRCEEELAGIVRLVHGLQGGEERIIVFESLKLRLLGPQVPHRYALDVRLRAHLVALAAPGQVAAGAATANADARLVASVAARAAAVVRHSQHAPALAQEPVLPPVTNLPPVVVVSRVPTNDAPVINVLTGIAFDPARGRYLARLNSRLVAEGDAVSDELRVLKIGANHVVLVDIQGTRQVVRMRGAGH